MWLLMSLLVAQGMAWCACRTGSVPLTTLVGTDFAVQIGTAYYDSHNTSAMLRMITRHILDASARIVAGYQGNVTNCIETAQAGSGTTIYFSLPLVLSTVTPDGTRTTEFLLSFRARCLQTRRILLYTGTRLLDAVVSVASDPTGIVFPSVHSICSATDTAILRSCRPGNTLVSVAGLATGLPELNDTWPRTACRLSDVVLCAAFAVWIPTKELVSYTSNRADMIASIYNVTVRRLFRFATTYIYVVDVIRRYSRFAVSVATSNDGTSWNINSTLRLTGDEMDTDGNQSCVYAGPHVAHACNPNLEYDVSVSRRSIANYSISPNPHECVLPVSGACKARTFPTKHYMPTVIGIITFLSLCVTSISFIVLRHRQSAYRVYTLLPVKQPTAAVKPVVLPTTTTTSPPPPKDKFSSYRRFNKST